MNKPGVLTIQWSAARRVCDFVVDYGNGCGGDGPRFCMHHVCDQKFLDELESRGYDPKTLRFTIKRKPEILAEALARLEDKPDVTR